MIILREIKKIIKSRWNVLSPTQAYVALSETSEKMPEEKKVTGISIVVFIHRMKDKHVWKLI